MEIIYDQQSEYWTGHGWLVIKEEGEPAIASFKTEEEAKAFLADKSNLE